MKKIIAWMFFFTSFNLQLNAQFGNALDFDGTDDVVNCPVPSAIATATNQQFTIEFWVKPTAATLSKNWIFYSQPTYDQLVNLFMASDRKLWFRIGLNSSRSSTVALPLNTWSHVALVMPGSIANSRIYINGVDVSSTGFVSITPVYGSTGFMSIGAPSNGQGGFKGIIDELRIWTVAKTAAEINASMNNELTLPQPNLAAYYKFNQGVANGNNSGITTLSDEFNTNNGSLLNFALNGSVSNWVASANLAIQNTPTNKLIFTITPNPAKEQISVYGIEGETKFNIYDSVGRSVLNGKISKKENTIKVASLESGMYFIKIGNNNVKLLKQ